MTFTLDNAAQVQRFPRSGAFDRLTLQPRWEISNGAGGKRLVLEWSGADTALAELAEGESLQRGSTSLPNGAGVSWSPEHGIILDSVDLGGDTAATATLRAEYRQRNARETDEDVAKGLQSRDIGARWVERQETIEHWAARQKNPKLDGPFNAALFAAWLSESDPGLRGRLATLVDGKEVSLGDDEEDSDTWRGNDFTLAIAQRYNMGVQYVGMHMLQVEVDETWRKPPNISAKCNAKLAAIPAEHRPLFSVEGFKADGGNHSFIRAADLVVPAGAALFRRKVVYLCIPQSMSPKTPPLGWGQGPVDELLYPTPPSAAPQTLQ